MACGDRVEQARPAVGDAEAEPGTLVTSLPQSPASPDVTVSGRVVDDETGEAVSGGYVIVLAPGVSFEDWEKSSDEEVEELMAGAAVTDSTGRYEVPDLPRGVDFTVVVAARGHAPAIFESGLTVLPDDPPLTRIADVRLEPR
ncbi:MAG TPA: carboxypeptidase-like regulatory domain-containing protein [Gemmatimonadota bacterium]|nr:carboxypeptidase-like regulatory domain-containing protein [Gemmatimonadota bacterium]